MPSTSNGENNVYSSSTSGDGFNLPNIYPTNNDLLEGDGNQTSTLPRRLTLFWRGKFIVPSLMPGGHPDAFTVD
uniref:uncharacterized protein LOC120957848 isoform X3 n=1 Tax=Anopheles coluzzii TaxID=1518534 RepID=UPI0020FFE4A6|nr:uncharacterized protein LOC120957848 isoform X3 [Anopheles coluzzii]